MKMMADKQVAQDLLKCFLEFQCDLFDPSHTLVMSLRCIEIVSGKLQDDCATAEKHGGGACIDFLKKIFFQDKKRCSTTQILSLSVFGVFLVHIYPHLDRIQIRISNSPALDVNANSKPNKMVGMKNKAMSEVVFPSVEKKLSLEEITSNRVTEECLSIFNRKGAR